MEEQAMKKYFVYAAMLFAAVSAGAQTPYLEEINITGQQVTKTSDRKANVKMEFSLDGLKMNRQHSLRLVPVIVSEDGNMEQELPPLVINGKTRDKVQQRARALNGDEFNADAMMTVRRENGEAQAVSYEASVPFKRWMIGGNVQVRGYVTGCALCDEGHETASACDIFPAMKPVYVVPFIQPKEEIVKRRSETRVARLEFRRNSDRIDAAYKQNRDELQKVKESFQVVRDNSDLTITGIYVTGYASPEGTMTYNMDLSKRRAQAFTDYVRRDLDGIDRSLYHVAWKGEDWDEFRKEVVRHTELEQQQEILQLIDNCGDDKDACEAEMRKLVPAAVYTKLVNEVYAPVRRNEYRIEYNVRHFTIEEGRKMIVESPQLMSVSEIHKVANSYGKGTPQYIDCLLTGAKTYPQDVVAVNNAALALIEAQRTAEAVALLEKSPRDGALQNMLGAAYVKLGQPEKAIEAFGRAAKAGHAHAAKNLETLQAYMEYIAE